MSRHRRDRRARVVRRPDRARSKLWLITLVSVFLVIVMYADRMGWTNHG